MVTTERVDGVFDIIEMNRVIFLQQTVELFQEIFCQVGAQTLPLDEDLASPGIDVYRERIGDSLQIPVVGTKELLGELAVTQIEGEHCI